MKKYLMLAAALLFSAAMFTSCKSYDLKECDKLSEKIEEDDLKTTDYEEMVKQLDGLLTYCQDKLDEIKDIEGKSERCDKYDDFDESDEAEYTTKFYFALEKAKENGDLKNEAKDSFRDYEIKSRYNKIKKAALKLYEKCENRRRD